MENKKMKDDEKNYYGDYLMLDGLLDLQQLRSKELNRMAHDEMLFIVTHQAYELWFKQILFELNSIINVFEGGAINDNSPDMELAVHRLGRICEIWKLLINQITVLETMTPLDFLDFRNLLVPASGFQSYQFRYIEALLGLKMGGRHGKNYYMQQFKSKHINELKDYENTETLLDLVNKWLSRFPFFKGHYWEDYESLKSDNSFWKDYFFLYGESLSNGENKEKKLKDFSLNFMDDNNSDEFTLQVNRTALFIILFRDYPLLQQPFKVIDRLIEVDQLMSTWRYRHMTMVRRMIGMRTGTGGTTGKGYLEGAASHNHIFNNFAGLSTYLIERRNLPRLPKKLIAELSFLKR